MREKISLAGFRAKAHCAMQYNKGRAIANRQGEPQEQTPNVMLRMLSQFVLRILTALVPLALGACADTLTKGKSTIRP
jgi:hypothetical protein